MSGVIGTIKSPTYGRVDIIHSPDDNGYYGQLWSDMDTVTEVYADQDELINDVFRGSARGLERQA